VAEQVTATVESLTGRPARDVAAFDDPVVEADRVTIRWTLRGTNTGPMLGRPPTGQPVELAAIVIFRIADGRIAERWGGWKPGYAPGR
jgi:predicted ester cyclase